MSKPPAGHFNILYFASASSFTSKSNEHLAAPVKVRDLFAELEKLYPGIKEAVLDSCLITINLEYVDVPPPDAATEDQVIIKEGDEVAIIPPVSSG